MLTEIELKILFDIAMREYRRLPLPPNGTPTTQARWSILHNFLNETRAYLRDFYGQRYRGWLPTLLGQADWEEVPLPGTPGGGSIHNPIVRVEPVVPPDLMEGYPRPGQIVIAPLPPAEQPHAPRPLPGGFFRGPVPPANPPGLVWRQAPGSSDLWLLIRDPLPPRHHAPRIDPITGLPRINPGDPRFIGPLLPPFHFSDSVPGLYDGFPGAQLLEDSLYNALEEQNLLGGTYTSGQPPRIYPPEITARLQVLRTFVAAADTWFDDWLFMRRRSIDGGRIRWDLGHVRAGQHTPTAPYPAIPPDLFPIIPPTPNPRVITPPRLGPILRLPGLPGPGTELPGTLVPLPGAGGAIVPVPPSPAPAIPPGSPTGSRWVWYPGGPGGSAPPGWVLFRPGVPTVIHVGGGGAVTVIVGRTPGLPVVQPPVTAPRMGPGGGMFLIGVIEQYGPIIIPPIVDLYYPPVPPIGGVPTADSGVRSPIWPNLVFPSRIRVQVDDPADVCVLPNDVNFTLSPSSFTGTFTITYQPSIRIWTGGYPIIMPGVSFRSMNMRLSLNPTGFLDVSVSWIKAATSAGQLIQRAAVAQDYTLTGFSVTDGNGLFGLLFNVSYQNVGIPVAPLPPGRPVILQFELDTAPN